MEEKIKQRLAELRADADRFAAFINDRQAAIQQLQGEKAAGQAELLKCQGAVAVLEEVLKAGAPAGCPA